MMQKRMSCTEADTLLYYLENLDFVQKAKVYERTQDAVICFSGDRKRLIGALQRFSYTKIQVPEEILFGIPVKRPDQDLGELTELAQLLLSVLFCCLFQQFRALSGTGSDAELSRR